MCDNYENYEKLAEAIILLAVEDYRKSCCNQTRYAIERFFRSDWFMVLTDIDGEKLIKKLRAERMMNRE